MAKRRDLHAEKSRERLESMIELAQSYRGWSQKEAAEALGRNVHAIIPDSGNPKLDMVVSLSEILDWPIEMVVADLRGKMDAVPSPTDAASGKLSVEEAIALVREAWAMANDERWGELIAYTDPEMRSGLDGETFGHLMALRQNALESDGRYLDAMSCCREGLLRAPEGGSASSRLRACLAYHLFIVGAFHEASGVALELIHDLREISAESPLRTFRAFAQYVRGRALRARSESAGDKRQALLEEAHALLRAAAQTFGALSGPGEAVSRDRALMTIASTSAEEIEVLMGSRDPGEFVAGVLDKLDRVINATSIDSTEAESLGWSCLLAAETILRHPGSVETPDRTLAVLTNKVDEIAERLGHWGLRERLFGIEFVYRARDAESSPPSRDWNLDREDVRILAGTMGRFPAFRRIGWQILRAVKSERAGDLP